MLRTALVLLLLLPACFRDSSAATAGASASSSGSGGSGSTGTTAPLASSTDGTTTVADPTTAGPPTTSTDAASDASTGDPATTSTASTSSASSSSGDVPAPPQKQVFFSRPLPGGTPDLTIEDAIGELVDLAVPGSTVRVALYHWSRTDIAARFVAAHEAGVDVQIVLDRENQDDMGVDWDAVALLKQGLGEERVLLCDELAGSGACIGTGINHNKFFLFSELADGSRDVVAQSSANMTNPQLHKHNNMVVIRDDAALHAAYLTYWSDLRAQVASSDYYHYVDGDTGARVYFFPRAAGDTIVSVLGNVTCDPGAQVRVAMAFFTDARLAVAERLADLRAEGCEVAVIVVDDAQYPGDDVVATLESAGVDLTLYPEGPTDEGLHSKYLLIDATYSGTPGARLLWTGSHNYTGPALRDNDETLLKLDDPALYDAFLADWLAMKALAGTF